MSKYWNNLFYISEQLPTNELLQRKEQTKENISSLFTNEEESLVYHLHKET